MTEKITMIELFSGIGAQERALRQLNIPYEVTHTCDLDKDAVLSYAAMRNDFESEFKAYSFPSVEDMISELQSKNVGYDFMKGKHTITTRTSVEKLKQYYLADKLSHNLGDIGKIERLPYADMVTYSFPCTDLSVAGKGEGMQNKCDSCGHSWPIDFSNTEDVLVCPNCGEKVSSSTRSGLLGQVQRLLAVAYDNNELPKYLLLENVKNLVGKKFVNQFNAWIKWLDDIGYNTYYEVLNAKHYGIPQNRERIFALSIRKDIDNGEFKFPERIPLNIRLKDILEKNVDERYYLPDDRIEKILNSTFVQEKKRIQMKDVCDTLLARDWKDPKCVQVEDPFIVASRGRNPDNSSDRTTGAPTEQRLEPNFSGCTNTLTSVQKDNYVAEPQVLRAERTEYGKAIRKQYEAGEVYEKISNMRELSPRTDGVSNTITTLLKDNYVYEPQVKNVGNIYPSNGQNGNVYDVDGISPTINAGTGVKGCGIGSNNAPKVIIPELLKDNCVHEPQMVIGSMQANSYIGDGSISPSLTAAMGMGGGQIPMVCYVSKDPIIYDDYNSRISADQDAINTLTTNCGASAERNGVKILEPIVCEERRDEGIRFFKDECVGTLRTIDACGDKRVLEPEPQLEFVGGLGNKDWAKDGKKLSRNYPQGSRVYSSDGIASALTAQGVGGAGGYSGLYAVDEEPKNIKWRIRKLTPKECWRLMGFTDEDHNRAAKYVSASSLYKQAGNSICTCCLITIFNALFLQDYSDSYADKLVDYNS